MNAKVETNDFMYLLQYGEKVKEYLTAKIKKQDNQDELFNELNSMLETFKAKITAQF